MFVLLLVSLWFHWQWVAVGVAKIFLCQNKSKCCFTQIQMQENTLFCFFFAHWTIFEFLSVCFVGWKAFWEQKILTDELDNAHLEKNNKSSIFSQMTRKWNWTFLFIKFDSVFFTQFDKKQKNKKRSKHTRLNLPELVVCFLFFLFFGHKSEGQGWSESSFDNWQTTTQTTRNTFCCWTTALRKVAVHFTFELSTFEELNHFHQIWLSCSIILLPKSFSTQVGVPVPSSKKAVGICTLQRAKKQHHLWGETWTPITMAVRECCESDFQQTNCHVRESDGSNSKS